jgi:integration host factor subunit beta
MDSSPEVVRIKEDRKRRKWTRTELIDGVYEATGMERREVQTIVDLFIEEVKKALISRGTIELRGFGTFEIKIRNGRRGARNPQTGETFTVSPHGIVSFRAGRDLKKAVWDLEEEG